MVPLQDALVVGGRFEAGVDGLTPAPEIVDRILRGYREFFEPVPIPGPGEA